MRDNCLHLCQTFWYAEKVNNAKFPQVGLAEVWVIQNSQPDCLERRDSDRASFALQLFYRPARIKICRVTVRSARCQASEEEGHTTYVM